MFTGLAIQILGKVRGGHFCPDTFQPWSYFKADRIAVGSKPWSIPALVLPDSTVSPKHAVILQDDQGWIIQDMNSDNGIRSLATVPGGDGPVEPGQQGVRFEFKEELCCCVGAMVLRLKAVL